MYISDLQFLPIHHRETPESSIEIQTQWSVVDRRGTFEDSSFGRREPVHTSNDDVLCMHSVPAFAVTNKMHRTKGNLSLWLKRILLIANHNHWIAQLRIPRDSNHAWLGTHLKIPRES